MSHSPPDAVTDALWKRVCADFESDKAHQAFLTHCQQADALVEAARLYRDHKHTLNEDQADEREAVDKRLAAIAVLAMSQLDERRSQPRDTSRGTKILTVIAAVLAVASVIALAQAMVGAF